jgi:hypothetical protein
MIPLTQTGKSRMQRAKHPPIRNKIDLTDPAQRRAWTRRLKLSADELKAIVEKVGDSAAAVTKEIELQRQSRQPCPDSSGTNPPAELELPASA